MAKTKLDLTEMFGTFKVGKTENAIDKKASGAPSAQPPTAEIQKETNVKSQNSDSVRVSKRAAEQAISTKALPSVHEDALSLAIAPNVKKVTAVESVIPPGSKSVAAHSILKKAKTPLVHLDFKIDIDIKDKFQTLCLSYGYTMTEILKEFILQSVKKGKL